MTEVQEILSTWRDAERLLDALPPAGSDHETVRSAVERLQASYQQLTGDDTQTDEVIADSRATISQTRDIIDRIRATAPSARGDMLIGPLEQA
jgi:hypothetical protein